VGPKPEVKAELEAYYSRIENDVIAYLDYYTSKETGDERTRALLEIEAVEPPEEYLYYLEVREIMGDELRVSAGGYYDQPFHLTEVLRRCKRGETRFKTRRAQQNTSAARSDRS
jgi:hypothetical protein